MSKSSVSPIQSHIRQVYRHPLRKRKRSNNIIHVTVRPRGSATSIYRERHPNSSRSIPITTSRRNQQNNDKNLSINRVEQRPHSSSKTTRAWSDRHGATKAFHREKKKKCTRRCIIGSLVALLVLLLVVMIILLILLLRRKSPQSIQTSIAILRWNTTGITLTGIAGVLGNTSNMLNTPRGITLDFSCTLYVADFGNARVQKYSRDASSGTAVAGNSTSGSSPGELAGPSSVYLDANRNMFVADTGNHRIQFWSYGANSGLTVTGNSSGGSGINTSNLDPFAVALDTNSNAVYVADSNNYRILSFALGTLSVSVIAGGNGAGLNDTQLWSPATCYLDTLSNSLLIANIDGNNIVRWKLGDNHWTLIAGDSNGLAGNTSMLFQSPRDLTLDPMGNLYVADRDNHRIQFLFADQSNAITIAGVTGISGTNATLLNTPKSVVLDNQLNLYVSDSNNHRIQKFQRY